jgi:hypothetical protein
MAQSGLLSLPKELRDIIFSDVLGTVHCKYPILVWDHISIANTAGSSSKGVGILLACRTTYNDCIALIYDNAVAHMSVRGDTQGLTPLSSSSLGPIQKCSLLPRLKHIQLEISYRASQSESVKRVVDRVTKLSKTFKKSANLKTVELIFFDEGSRHRTELYRTGSLADPIVDAVIKLDCQDLVAVSRNSAAKWNMSGEKWKLLREKAGEAAEGAEEFREITFDYWEHAFKWKN